jgi:CspA family cold shock protein
MTGTIKNINVERGFGFIRAADGTDRFFHYTALRGGTKLSMLSAGMPVTFDHEQSERGPRAVNVEIAG